MAYGHKIQAHVNDPKNLGKLDKNAQDVGTGFVGNPECGDMLKLQIKVENGVIQDVKSKTFGCGCAIAATSLATEKLKGRTLDQAKQLTNQELADELELPKIKIHCSVLAKQAVSKAIDDYMAKNDADGTYDIVMKDADSILSVQKAYTSSSSEGSSESSSCCKGEGKAEESSSCCSPSVAEQSACCRTVDQGVVRETQTQSTPDLFSKPMFKVTPVAFNRFYQIVTEHKAKGIKLFSESGGCAGNSYNIDLVTEEMTASGKTFSYEYEGKSIDFFIPQSSLIFFIDLTVDYQITDTCAEFKFSSPTLKTCGCGSSFR